MTFANALRELVRHPGELLLRRWNWKSALVSSLLRATIFLFANLSAGWRAATGAMLAEFCFRAVTAGFYGAMTQAFCRIEPEWKAGLAAILFVPLVSHSLELTVHLMRGTPKLITSIIASVIFTIISTLFNVYAMRRGALVVCPGAKSVGSDFRRIPALIGSFLAAGPLALYRVLSRDSKMRRVTSSPRISKIA